MDSNANKFIYLQQTINGLKYKLSAAEEINYNLDKELKCQSERNQLLKNLNSEFTHRVKGLVTDNEQLKEDNNELLRTNHLISNELQALKLETKTFKTQYDCMDSRVAGLEADLEAKTNDCETCTKELQYQKVFCKLI